MARRRFLVEQIRDNTAELRGDDARHLARVLRAEPGQQYEIADGAAAYLAEIADVHKDRIVFRVLEPLAAAALAARLTLAAALIKFDRFEWLVEKATEVGVASIIPVVSARSEKGLADAAPKRAERWRRIAHESAQQCRRLAPPEIAEPQALASVLAADAAFRFLLDEQPGAPALLSAIPPPAHRRPTDTIALLTGPEGGWAETERNAAIAAGWMPVSLGPLILRAETAAITAASLLLHSWWMAQLE